MVSVGAEIQSLNGVAWARGRADKYRDYLFFLVGRVDGS